MILGCALPVLAQLNCPGLLGDRLEDDGWRRPVLIPSARFGLLRRGYLELLELDTRRPCLQAPPIPKDLVAAELLQIRSALLQGTQRIGKDGVIPLP